MDERAKIFDKVNGLLENEKFKKLELALREEFPSYFWEVGASSTGKYHPSYALGEMGLARHTLAVVIFIEHFLEIESVANKFTSEERDCLRIAAEVHDFRKSGDDNDFKESKYTRFNHPIMASDVVRSYKGKIDGITDDEVEIICNALESHMGQWNKDKKSDLVLPKPENKYQIILHIADYFASRKDIEILFDEYKPTKTEIPPLEGYKLTFGKFNGQLLTDVARDNHWYIDWLKENYWKEPVKTLVKDL